MHPLHVWQSIRSLRPLVALFMLALIALPWYVAVGIETRGEWLEMFLGRHNLERFTSTLDGHRGPIVFYFLAVFVGFFPWSILLPQSVRETVRRLCNAGSFSRGDLFLACWVIAYVGFFSLAGTKLPNYITPCYPALALLTARMIEGYLAQPWLLNRLSWRLALVSLALVGVSLVIGLPIAALTILPGEAWLGAVGCVPVGGAWIAWRLSRDGSLHRALPSLAVTALVLALALFGVVLPQIDRHQTSENLVTSIRDHDQTPETPFQLMTYRFSQPSLIFYARRRIHNWGETAKVDEFFRQFPNDAYLITRSENLPELQSVLPADIVVLERRPQFLRRNREVVLLGRRPPSAHSQSITARPAAAFQ
jgi:4-amino-4-deoxy-L-arabinose transferase-like glycosyltransferase